MIIKSRRCSIGEWLRPKIQKTHPSLWLCIQILSSKCCVGFTAQNRIAEPTIKKITTKDDNQGGISRVHHVLTQPCLVIQIRTFNTHLSKEQTKTLSVVSINRSAYRLHIIGRLRRHCHSSCESTLGLHIIGRLRRRCHSSCESTLGHTPPNNLLKHRRVQ